jgi:hypothetical protein
MDLKLNIAISMIVVFPVLAQAQEPSTAKEEGRAKGRENYQRRQGQNPGLLRYR